MTSFEIFFKDPIYLLYKNHLYNYLVRRWGVRRLWKKGNFPKVMELGCGISPILANEIAVVRTDLSWQAMAFLKTQMKNSGRGRLVTCDAARLPFKDRSLDCVVCSEVLEHIEKDEEVLKEISRVLTSGGSLFLTCPIHEKYFGFDDQFVGHYRRYEVPQLLQRLSAKGFKDFQVEPLLGPLEKWVMENTTKLFSLLKKSEGGSSALGATARWLAWLLFPFYLIFNYLLASMVYLQARSVPLEKAVTVLVQCRKSA